MTEEERYENFKKKLEERKKERLYRDFSGGLAPWMVEKAQETPWEELSWNSNQSPDLQEPLKELRRIKGALERANSYESPEGSNLPSPIDPTVPGFSGFGTELDMLLKKRRADQELVSSQKFVTKPKDLGG